MIIFKCIAIVLVMSLFAVVAACLGLASPEVPAITLGLSAVAWLARGATGGWESDAAQRRREIAFGLLTVFVLAGAYAHPIYVRLVIGWILFLSDVLGKIRVDPWALALGFATLTLFACGLEAFGRFGLSAPRRWRTRWTLAIVAVPILMFVAGLCAVGILSRANALWQLRDAPDRGAYR